MTAQIPIHPAASIFPLMSPQEFEKLKDSIAENGLREYLTLYQGELLDGRNRLRACNELGIEPSCEELLDEIDPWAYALDKKLRHTQLNVPQRSMSAARLPEAPEGRPSKNVEKFPGYTLDDASRLFGVSTKSIQQARRILKEGCTELIALCNAGKPVSKACLFIDACQDKRQQSKIAKGGWKAIQSYLKEAADSAPPARQNTKDLATLLPDTATEAEMASVERWLYCHSPKSPGERFFDVWYGADEKWRNTILHHILAERVATGAEAAVQIGRQILKAADGHQQTKTESTDA